jgi:hypothetical protein
MGRTFIRQTVANWFAPPAVEGLNTVYTASPRWAPGADFFQGAPAGTESGAIAFPYVEESHRTRIALQGAPPGGKMAYYTIGLVVRFVSNAAEVQAAQDDHDNLIDAIVVRLESDKLLGTGSNPERVFMAGEGDSVNGADVHVQSDLPKQHGTQVTVWSVVRFAVLEYIASGTA